VRVAFFLLADAAVHRDRGKVDLLGAGVEAIFARAVPVVHPALTAAISVELTQDEAAVPHEIDVPGDQPGGRNSRGRRR